MRALEKLSPRDIIVIHIDNGNDIYMKNNSWKLQENHMSQAMGNSTIS